jgi:hypothetical protein
MNALEEKPFMGKQLAGRLAGLFLIVREEIFCVVLVCEQ